MTISATSVRFDDVTMWVELTDGRTLGIPLAWFPRLLRATPAERDQVEISRLGLHWEALDEDISIAGLRDRIELLALWLLNISPSRSPFRAGLGCPRGDGGRRTKFERTSRARTHG